MPCSCLSRASIPLNRADASAYVMLGSRGALRSHLMIIWPGRLELSGPSVSRCLPPGRDGDWQVARINRTSW
jgi:hypothetical protein